MKDLLSVVLVAFLLLPSRFIGFGTLAFGLGVWAVAALASDPPQWWVGIACTLACGACSAAWVWRRLHRHRS